MSDLKSHIIHGEASQKEGLQDGGPLSRTNFKTLSDMAYMRMQAQTSESYNKRSAHNKSKDKESMQYMKAALRGPQEM